MNDSARFRFGPFELDPGTFKLLKHGTPVPLEPKALDLLRLLLERAPRVVDKAEISSIVWKDVAVTDNALTRLVAQLRKALEDDPKAPQYIETITTRGYRFVKEVTVLAAQPAAEPSAPDGAAAVIRRHLPRRHRNAWAVACALAVIIVLAGAWRVALPLLRSASGAQTTSPQGAPDIATFATLRPTQLTSGTGFDGFLSFAPDGTSIAYSSDRSGSLEIYVQGVAAGSTAIALTSNGRHNVQPVWSPDGQFIAYHEMAGNGLWIVPSRGGVPRRISEFGANPAWSPDGRRIAFQSLPLTDIKPLRRPGALATIWIVEVEGHGEPRPVTLPGVPAGPHLAPVWWRDSARLLFAVPSSPTSADGTSLWSVAIDGTAPRRLCMEGQFSPDFTLAPGGDGVYFVATGTSTIWWLPLTNDGTSAGEPRPTGLATSGATVAHLAVRRDGGQLAWTVLDSTNHIWATTADGSGVPQPLTEGRAVYHGLPSPASDGRVAFVGSRQGANTALFLLLPDGRLRQLTTDPANHSGPQWMPGEREIAFVTDHQDGPGFWAIDPETGRERLLFRRTDFPRPPPGSQASTAAPATNVAFTRDFTRLALAVVRDGAPNLWVTSLRNLRPHGPLVQRTFEREGGTYPAWSPDGRWIAYQCAEGTDTHVCVTGADGGAPVRLTNDPGQSWVGGWSPDGDRILFAARRDAVWNIAAVRRSSSMVKTLTRFTEPRIYVRYPRWDAARNRILFERSDTTSRILAVNLR
jgi:Tol biopolymer transport system component/DNA-binding winged helix-turn-helix (wHTH) protein